MMTMMVVVMMVVMIMVMVVMAVECRARQVSTGTAVCCSHARASSEMGAQRGTLLPGAQHGQVWALPELSMDRGLEHRPGPGYFGT